MKLLFLWSCVITATCAVTACEDGHSENGCVADVECAPGYVCDLSTNECVRYPLECFEPSDCGTNETCGSHGVCRVGDCSFHGCVTGFSCEVADSRYVCVQTSTESGAAGASGSSGVAGDPSVRNEGGATAAAGSSAGVEAGAGGVRSAAEGGASHTPAEGGANPVLAAGSDG